VPLALSVGIIGLLQLLPAVERALGLSSNLAQLNTAAVSLSSLDIRGLPQGVVGAVMVVTAVGMVMRSRFAWIIALLTAGASTVLAALPRTAGALPTPLVVSAVLFLLLLVSGRRFDRSSLAAGTLFALTSTVLLLTYAVLAAYALGDSFKPPIHDFGTALYFAVVTMATVGYGDIVPQTPQARFYVLSIILLGIAVFATSVSAILVPMMNRRMQRLLSPRREEMKRVDHYIIVGDTALARNSYLELQSRKESVTFVLPRTPEDTAFENADVVVGDGSDLEVLRRAGAEKARAVLALSGDDSENAFVVLATKELGGEAQTVAAVNDSKNISRVRMVQPDMMIAPQVLGGELLAMALAGEDGGNQELMDRFLRLR
jgi:voltage-gated potassium channel